MQELTASSHFAFKRLRYSLACWQEAGQWPSSLHSVHHSHRHSHLTIVGVWLAPASPQPSEDDVASVLVYAMRPHKGLGHRWQWGVWARVVSRDRL